MEDGGGGLLGPALDRLCGPSTATVEVDGVDGEVVENPTMTADDGAVPDDELGETVRATNRRASWSGGGDAAAVPAPPDPSRSDPHAAGATDALAASRDAAVAELLGICERSGVTVGPRLRRAILGEEMYDASIASSAGSGRPRRSVYAKRESALTFLARRNNESFHDESVTRDSDVVAEIRKRVDQVNVQGTMSFEVRVRDGSFTVDSPVVSGSRKKEAGTQHIPTVTNGGGFFKCYDAVRRLATTGTLRKETETKVIMDGVNLILEQGKMYLILGAPGCGKSVLLKMIANLLPREDENTVGGTVTVNGIESTDKGVIWTNIVSYVNQIERLHGYLTVKETIKFAFDCCYGQTHRGPFTPEGPEQDEAVAKMDEEDWLVNTIMRAVGIKRVEDTFVGGDRVRGVSGGEKKRVSVAEMMASRSYVDCLDEISTGLDAATTYDICKLLGEVTRMRNTVRIVSLLQPPPETVALFDEIILLDKGRVLYFGPVEEVTSHFKSLGYVQPPRMDPADWLQALPTKDGAKFLKSGEETVHLTNEQFVQKYNESPRGQDMLRRLESESPKGASLDHPAFHRRYANSTWESIKVVFFREFLLWRRDTYARKARLMQDLIMGLVVGTTFFQIDDPQTFMGVVFQCVFFVSMGAMLKVAPQIDVRGVFYKEQDANFYPTWIYVLARALAGIPTSLQDALIYGSLVYWMAGFTYQASSYFMFLLLILLCAFTCGVMFSFFSATIKDRPTAQACMSIALVVLVLFSGFTVQPDVIPPYYIWIYWINLFAWTIRAVVINEFESGEYDEVVNPQTGETQGEAIMRQFGFTLDGEPFHFVWTWWTVLFCIGLASVSIIMSVWCLNHVRFVTGGSLGGEEATADQSMKTSKLTNSQAESLESRGATITFKNVNYVVTASTSKDKLHLLKGISGYFEKGKMTALMGSSGAGKTTLMDVLSLRKASGDVSGEIRINGFPQDADGFRRMSGYVEQFDTQSPQLTVRETVEFSAKMRLSEEIPVATKQKFVDHVLEMLELDGISGFLVGSDSAGGLSFEQKKRLSIAVELASNPSVIFLDEPTSGLDARAASIVMRSLRRIADSGIAVVATIHQPSVAIFNSFDSLLLLKRGGEVVFFGELGDESYNLIEYLESYSTTKPIKSGENPATWMLTTIGAGSAGDGDGFDYAKAYSHSPLAGDCIKKIDEINFEPSDEIIFPSRFATSSWTQSREVYKRLNKIYWRSPGYNRVRLLVSGIVALVFGSVFASQRVPVTEGDMNSRITSIYITALFLGVNAMNTVLPVFEMERNMFYRHSAAMMYDYNAINLSFLLCEVPFIVLASFVFTILWYFTVGFSPEAAKFFLYWLFMAFSLGTFTFLGQGFMAIFRDSTTAQGFGALLIGMSSIFGGIIIRPQHMPSFWIWAYWTFPLHYVYEGLFTSQFNQDETPITPSYGSPFYDYVRTEYCDWVPAGEPLPDDCTGTAADWIDVAFGGNWTVENIKWDIVYLVGANVVAKVMTMYGLKQKNYLAK